MSAIATAIDYRAELMRMAKELVKQGPGYAQEGVILRGMQKEFQITRLPDQQRLLDEWQLLFRDGLLMWGYDIENPGRPWFHLPKA